MIEFHFFLMPIHVKTLGSLEKNMVGRETGNTHIYFFCLSKVHGRGSNVFFLGQLFKFLSNSILWLLFCLLDLLLYIHGE